MKYVAVNYPLYTIRIVVVILYPFFCAGPLFAQGGEYSSDELFQQARKKAFDQKDYTMAIQLSKKALEKSPDYIDILNFIARLYTWSDQADSARQTLVHILAKHPENEEAYTTYADLEYWNGHSLTSLQYCDSGLLFHPQSELLLFRRAKALNDLHRYKEALFTAEYLLKLQPGNAEVRRFADRLKDNSAKNMIGLSYDFSYFDKQFKNPWQVLGLEYGRQTKSGSIIARLNYANRFKTNGIQYELDAYPRISHTFYTYLNVGYSNDVGVFPGYRAGF
jgi:tetratricopeptide (TPR) repeat protein